MWVKRLKYWKTNRAKSIDLEVENGVIPINKAIITLMTMK